MDSLNVGVAGAILLHHLLGGSPKRFPVLSRLGGGEATGLHGSPGYLRPRLLLRQSYCRLLFKGAFPGARGRNQIGFELVCTAAARTLAAHLRVGWQREISIKSSYKTTRDACRSLAP